MKVYNWLVGDEVHRKFANIANNSSLQFFRSSEVESGSQKVIFNFFWKSMNDPSRTLKGLTVSLALYGGHLSVEKVVDGAFKSWTL